MNGVCEKKIFRNESSSRNHMIDSFTKKLQTAINFPSSASTCNLILVTQYVLPESVVGLNSSFSGHPPTRNNSEYKVKPIKAGGHFQILPTNECM